jgi:hypothetical protein
VVDGEGDKCDALSCEVVSVRDVEFVFHTVVMYLLSEVGSRRYK